METIQELCQSHRRKEYWQSPNGLVGIRNHNFVIVWYRYIPNVGYSLTGTTQNPSNGDTLVQL